ncbi:MULTISPECIES: type I restriction enzyme HsdR N-terminal domain-containing protein [Psychroflexus]|uniref:Type I restriction enzyme R protein N terminus (HSDR_N) n=1 Tax=Psychroflexus halocasei TaxID=908615 RepID=A0A1H4DMG1_9FLAO|nr:MULTISPECIES: type I restriction enzyme HsdR N-terminal domain-containing protein [Psychroflexus]PJX24007.1 restriction endonuclease subunit R [Psychroflexus sp. S27]SEA73951.1 Type I restriction enzyme R protein N terminus (HSDR_N) [Psychroflexus halocasei]
MQVLNFPAYHFDLKSNENNKFIFSRLRKKYLHFTPEEWVRQHCVQYLVKEKNFSINLLNEEKQVMINGMSKRYDLVGYQPNGKIRLLVECKAPSVKITQDTFDQIARYNMILKADYLMVTNGIQHYYCQIDYEKETYIFLRSLPDFKSLRK